MKILNMFKRKSLTDKTIDCFIKRYKKHRNIELAILESLIKYHGDKVVKLINIEELYDKILK